MKRWIKSGIIFLGIVALAACGSSSGDGDPDPATSSNATEAVSAIVLGSNNSSSGTAITGSTDSSLILPALIKEQIGGFKTAVITVESTSMETNYPCTSGLGIISTMYGGTVTFNDDTGTLTDIDIDVENTIAFSSCTPEDIATTDIDESSYVIDGSIDGIGGMSNTAPNSIDMVFSTSGSLTVSGACSGLLTFDASMDLVGVSSGITSCSTSGSVWGTICDVEVDCEMSGGCDTPFLIGTGCD